MVGTPLPAGCLLALEGIDGCGKSTQAELLLGWLRERRPDGKVELLPTGQILIDAAAEKQAEIAALLDSIASRSVAETPTITLRYWVLFGVVGAEQQTAVPPMLDGVVREWESAHG